MDGSAQQWLEQNDRQKMFLTSYALDWILKFSVEFLSVPDGWDDVRDRFDCCHTKRLGSLTCHAGLAVPIMT